MPEEMKMSEPDRLQPGAAQSPTILCVDDEPNILSALRRTLTSFGYRVITADSGQQGLKLLQDDPAEVVISDMRMPGMDGVSFLEYVSVRWPDSTRVLLTGYSSLEATVDAVNRGRVFSYISKPWEDDELHVTVQQALNHFRVTEENRRLADQVRSQQKEIGEQQREIDRLKRLHPQLMQVERDERGAINLEDLEDQDDDSK